MELEFGKHFKDATNLLLMMDHDSGYVEGTENYTSSSNESDYLKENVNMRAYTEPDNFLLSEDALLEKPEIYLNLGNFENQINNEDYEETRRLFFSPEVISSSVKSQDSLVIYSGLENETSSEVSGEISIQAPIQFPIQELPQKSCIDYQQIQEPDVSTTFTRRVPVEFKIQESSQELYIDHEQIRELDVSTASASDMSLEVSMFEPAIIEKKHRDTNNSSSMSPFKGFPATEGHVVESTIKLLVNKSLNDDINEVKDGILETKEHFTNICSFSQDKRMLDDKCSSKTKNSDEITSKTSSSKVADTLLTKTILETSNTVLEPCGSTLENTEANDASNDDWKVGSIPRNQTPSKTNPLSIVTNTFEVSKEKRRLTLVFSKSDKENGSYNVKRKYPSMTPEKNYENPNNSYASPEIFGDDEVIEDKPSYFEIQSLQPEEKYVNKLDQKLLKRTQKSMSGVLPPPSLTVIHMSVVDILTKLDENKSYFWGHDTAIKKNNNDEAKNLSLNSSSESTSCSKSLLVNVDPEKAKTTDFPDVLNIRYHGLYHNCGKISEEIVDLCDKYQKRCIGAETQSTCTVFEIQNLTSPTKRKMAKPKWGGKSPGRRLSHLARRRITFSSANLQAGVSSLAGSRARQILVDARKMELLNRRRSPRKSLRRTPRKTPKKTPSKSPKVKTRTPSSSAKKKLAMRFRKLTGEFEKSIPSAFEVSSAHRTLFKSPERGTMSENSKGSNKSTKRALFQSPQRDKSSSLFTDNSQDFSSSEEKNQLRRALFTSPRKTSPLKGKKSPFKPALVFGLEKKRKRNESEDMRPSKFSRSMSMDVRPSTSSFNNNKSFSRAQSELNISLNRSQSQNELTEQHRKKLQWAVYSALQSQNITNSHPQWKVWASVLARVTSRFFTSQMKIAVGGKLEGGTTERMNRIARRHVLSVIKGKSVEEIINEYISSRPKVNKPQGYVAPKEFDNMKNKMASDIKGNVFQDRVNTIESWEKKKLKQMSKPMIENKIERIRKVINFGDDR